MGIFARRHGTPLYMTQRTRAACAKLLRGKETIVEYRPGRAFNISEMFAWSRFLTVHDAADPVGVTLVDECTGLRLGVATDLGKPTAQVRHALSSCDLLILEANHDEVLLHTSAYPASVRRRIASSHGHLSNQAAARFVVDLLHPRLAGVVLGPPVQGVQPARAGAQRGRRGAGKGWLVRTSGGRTSRSADRAARRRRASLPGRTQPAQLPLIGYAQPHSSGCSLLPPRSARSTNQRV